MSVMPPRHLEDALIRPPGSGSPVSAGQCFVTDRAGPLVISALGVAELYIEWPLHDIERLSPGLESTVAAA